MTFKKNRDGTFTSDPKGTYKLPSGDALKDLDNRPPVRDGAGRPLVRGGPRAGKVDWERLEREQNGEQ